MFVHRAAALDAAASAARATSKSDHVTNILPQVLEILPCPVPECRASLRIDASSLLCSGCGRRYRIEDNWPVLIPEQADPPYPGGKAD